MSKCTPPFCDGMSKGNQNPSSKVSGEGEHLRCAKFARKARSSSSMSTKIWPWAAWMVMIVSNVRWMSKSFEVDGGGIVVAAAPTGSTGDSPKVVPIEEGGGVVPEGSTRRHLELSLIWAALCLRQVVPMGAIMCTGSEARKSSKPKNKKKPTNENRLKMIRSGRGTPMNFV